MKYFTVNDLCLPGDESGGPNVITASTKCNLDFSKRLIHVLDTMQILNLSLQVASYTCTLKLHYFERLYTTEVIKVLY